MTSARLSAVLCLAALWPAAAAGQCLNYYSQSYAYPVNHGYVPPTANYYSYQPVQKVVAQEIAVAPLIVTVPVVSQAVPIEAYGARHYYSVREAYQEKAYLRQIIREELRAAMAQAAPPAEPPSPPAAAPAGGYAAAAEPEPAPSPPVPRSPAPAAVPAPAPAAKNGGKAAKTAWRRDTTTPPELAKQLLGVFKQNRCATCHGPQESGGLRLVLDDDTLVDHPPAVRWAIYGMASATAMPPDAAKDPSKRVPDEQMLVILRYAAQKGK